MSTDVPPPDADGRKLKITCNPGPGVIVVPSDDPTVVKIKVPVARVPAGHVFNDPPAKQPTVAILPPVEPSNTSPPSANSSSLGTPPSGSASIDLKNLPGDVEVLKQMLAEVLRELRKERHNSYQLQQQVDALIKRVRGERAPKDAPGQGLLYPDDDTSVSPVEVPVPPSLEDPEKESKPKRKCRPHGRSIPPANLRRVPKRHELTDAELNCPDCGSKRVEFGVETTYQYEYKPAEVYVIEHQRVKYACKGCEGCVAIGPKPIQLIDKCAAGPGLLAQIITDKYQDHLPLHRIEQRFARPGVHLPRSTMCDWMAGCANVMTPLWQLLKDWVLQSKVLHTDDTTAPVRDESLDKHRYGRLWGYIGDHAHPGIVFDYTKTHARDGPAAFLKTFKGFLQADAYGAYDGIYTGSNGTIVEVGCWAHARNKAVEATDSDPERVLAIKAWIRKLYDVEDEAENMSAADRLRLRQEKSVPLLTSLRQWLLAQQQWVLPKSSITTAINYMLNQWDALNRYTTDGDLHIDNNVSERTLKLIGMGRLNWLFLGSDKGGQTAAVLYTLTATCKQLGIDTAAYLRDVFERLPEATDLAELLPHRWQAARQADATATIP